METTITETLDNTPEEKEVVNEKPQSTLKEKASAEEIQTDVKSRLAKRSDKEDVFVPSTSAMVEKAAKQIAEQQGFEYNRGTSIGARLIAQSRGIK